jgi:DNA helicase-2/ATP-dependent DNA helicase PcrA
LARFIDERVDVLAAHLFQPDRLFVNIFFGSFLYALFRLGESEYENAEDPFPRGRIPFLTIHQAKGLEFPVVVLGNTAKRTNGPQRIEEMLHPFLDRDGEPLERMAEYDAMRMFYVALSRAQNLLVLAHPRGQGISLFPPFKHLLEGPMVRIPAFDIATLPPAKAPEAAVPHNYSYTADYMLYQKCPRQYMIFRQYGFIASRSQTQMFGSLIHRTLEDLHQYLIAQRKS